MTALLLAAAAVFGSWTLADRYTAPIVVLYEDSKPCEFTAYAIMCYDEATCPKPMCPDPAVIAFNTEAEFREWLRSRKCSDRIRVFGAKLPACKTVTKQVQPPPVPVESAEWEEK